MISLNKRFNELKLIIKKSFYWEDFLILKDDVIWGLLLTSAMSCFNSLANSLFLNPWQIFFMFKAHLDQVLMFTIDFEIETLTFSMHFSFSVGEIAKHLM